MNNTYMIELPKSAFSTFRKEPKEFLQEMKYAALVKWYEMGELSQSKAAEISGLTRHEFLMLLYRYRVSIIQYTQGSLKEELKYAR